MRKNISFPSKNADYIYRNPICVWKVHTFIFPILSSEDILTYFREEFHFRIDTSGEQICRYFQILFRTKKYIFER